MKARSVDTRRGGNKRSNRSGGTRYRGAPAGRRAPQWKLYARTPQDSPGKGVCPTCKRQVPLRKDGLVVGHRVGPSMSQAWGCPGGGQEPEGVDR